MNNNQQADVLRRIVILDAIPPPLCAKSDVGKAAWPYAVQGVGVGVPALGVGVMVSVTSVGVGVGVRVGAAPVSSA